MVRPSRSTICTSGCDLAALAGPTDWMRPSTIETAWSRFGSSPEPSMSEPPRSSKLGGRRHQYESVSRLGFQASRRFSIFCSSANRM